MSRPFTSSTYVNPVTVANETLLRSGQPFLPNGRAIDVEAIARQFCGLELMFIPDLNPSGKSLLGLFTPTLNAIMVNSDSIEVRQRFTIAHEIGHVRLEHGHGNAASLFEIEEPETFECTADDEGLADMDERAAGLRRRKEIRANQFAAHLLMPEGLVREVWREEHEDLERTAHALQVSKESLGYRLRSLRLH
jgi:Zn-dependent peptidase ImmA (M78 family)